MGEQECNLCLTTPIPGTYTFHIALALLSMIDVAACKVDVSLWVNSYAKEQ